MWCEGRINIVLGGDLLEEGKSGALKMARVVVGEYCIMRCCSGTAEDSLQYPYSNTVVKYGGRC